MALIDVERDVLCVCFKAEPPEAALSALGDRRTWLLYRSMVRERLWKEIAVALPRTRRAAGDGVLERVFERHLDEDPPRSRFFHGIVLEFATSALPALRADASLAPWVADLAEYEAALWEVSDLDGRPSAAPAELSFDRPPLLSPTLRLLSLAYPVHESPRPDGSYVAAARTLAIFRAADDQRPRTWAINAVTHELLRMWQADPGLSISQGVRTLGRTRGIAVDEAFVDKLCDVLARFVEVGLVLGSR